MLLNILNFVFDCNLSEFDCIFLFLTIILGNRALLVFPWMKSLHWMPTLPINRRRAMQCKEWNWTDDESNFKSPRNAFINVDRLRQTFSSSSASSPFASPPLCRESYRDTKLKSNVRNVHDKWSLYINFVLLMATVSWRPPPLPG